VRNQDGLTCGEWIEALKMTANVAPVKAVPGRSQDGSHCRRCRSEFESLAHVLGVCPFNEVLRNSRHHKIRKIIADSLRNCGLEVYEEVHGLANDGSSRRIDIIAINRKSNSGTIIDPTIRVETHLSQPEEVHIEKSNIYKETVPYYKNKYNLKEINVIGLMVGARGTITTKFVTFCKQYGVTKKTIKQISLSALKDSIKILRNHLYNNF